MISKYKDFEDFLQMEHQKEFIGTKETVEEAFFAWTEDLELDQWISLGNQFVKEELLNETKND